MSGYLDFVVRTFSLYPEPEAWIICRTRALLDERDTWDVRAMRKVAEAELEAKSRRYVTAESRKHSEKCLSPSHALQSQMTDIIELAKACGGYRWRDIERAQAPHVVLALKAMLRAK